MNKTTYANDKAIVEGINNHDSNAWEIMYEKYAPTMLAAIAVFIKNNIMAEKLLIDIFIALREEDTIQPGNSRLSLYLYMYSFKFTIEQLRAKGIQPYVVALNTYPQIIQLLCKKYGVEERQEAELYSRAELKIRRNSFCWLPVFGINPFVQQVKPAINF